MCVSNYASLVVVELTALPGFVVVVLINLAVPAAQARLCNLPLLLVFLPDVNVRSQTILKKFHFRAVTTPV